MSFDGETYDPELDGERLTKQLDRVRACMSDGRWRTLAEIEAVVKAPQSSISARLRDLRKDKFGGFLIERRRRGDSTDGLFEYQMVNPPTILPGGQISFLPEASYAQRRSI